MFETERAIAMQPELLSLDWDSRISKSVRSQLKDVKKITFIGTGSSYHCAVWADWLCSLSAGPKPFSRAMMSWDFLAGAHVKTALKNELFVVVSHRGYKDLTKKLLDQLKNHKRILITGEGSVAGKNPTIFTSPQEKSQAHTMSLIGAMAACSEIVASQLSASEAKRLVVNRNKCAALIESLKINSDAASRFMAVAKAKAFHFVGGGPQYFTAMELALKAREMARLPAHFYNTEQLLHGPLAGLRPNDAVVLIPAIKPPSGTLNTYLFQERLLECAKQAKARKTILLQPEYAGSFLSQATKLPLSWQAVIDLVWGQYLCLSLAKNLGFNPDLAEQIVV